MAKRFTISALFRAEDKASGPIDKISGRVGKLGTALRVGLAAAFAAGAAAATAFAVAMRQGIEASQVQEQAVADLTASLAKFGPAGEAAAESAQRFAAAQQQLTIFGDEAIIKAQALLITYGATPETLNAATQATLDFAAATGKSLDEAAANVGKTFGGLAGELGELVPAMKDLSAEALQAGGAIGVLDEAFGGQAAARAKTFSGLIQQIKNAYGDLLEVLGDSVTQNDQVRESLEKLRDVLSSGGLVDGIVEFAKGVASTTTAFIEGAQSVADWGRGLSEAGNVVKAFAESIPGVSEALGAFNRQQERQLELQQRLGSFIKERLIDPFLELGRATRQQAEAEADLVANEEALSQAFEERLATLVKLKTATEEQAEADSKEAAAQSELTSALSDAGIAFVDVAKEIEKQNRALAAARDAYRNRVIDLQELERIEKEVAGSLAELRGEVEEQNAALDDTSAAARAAGSGLDEFGAAADRNRGALVALRGEADRTTDALLRTASAGGSGIGNSANFGSTLTGGSRLFPDSDIANTAIRNGVRVRVSSNGRRSAA